MLWSCEEKVLLTNGSSSAFERDLDLKVAVTRDHQLLKQVYAALLHNDNTWHMGKFFAR